MSKILFSVLFNGVKVFNSDNDVQALGFALSLHQTSNVEHEISVLSDSHSVAFLVTPGYPCSSNCPKTLADVIKEFESLDEDNKSCEN